MLLLQPQRRCPLQSSDATRYLPRPRSRALPLGPLPLIRASKLDLQHHNNNRNPLRLQDGTTRTGRRLRRRGTTRTRRLSAHGGSGVRLAKAAPGGSRLQSTCTRASMQLSRSSPSMLSSQAECLSTRLERRYGWQGLITKIPANAAYTGRQGSSRYRERNCHHEAH